MGILLDFIARMISNDVLREKLVAMHSHESIRGLIETVPASVKRHHNWTGGYHDHVLQVMKYSKGLYDKLYGIGSQDSMIKPGPTFTEDDILLVACVHDLDKLFRYRRLKEPKDGREWDHVKNYPSYDESAKVAVMCAEYGIILSDEELSALAMHHGGWADKAGSGGEMTPMAVILHSADLISTCITNHKGD